jgi:hypothetical protein
MPEKTWDKLSPNEKADALRREFDAREETERHNIEARGDRHKQLVTRLDALEATLKQIESRVARLERKNDV